MKLKCLVVILLFLFLTMMTMVAIYLIHHKTAELDSSVIVSMVVGGMFVILSMARRKYKEEGRE